MILDLVLSLLKCLIDLSLVGLGLYSVFNITCLDWMLLDELSCTREKPIRRMSEFNFHIKKVFPFWMWVVVGWFLTN